MLVILRTTCPVCTAELECLHMPKSILGSSGYICVIYCHKCDCKREQKIILADGEEYGCPICGRLLKAKET